MQFVAASICSECSRRLCWCLACTLDRVLPLILALLCLSQRLFLNQWNVNWDLLKIEPHLAGDMHCYLRH